jgi:AcrR family transcriptional regulator
MSIKDTAGSAGLQPGASRAVGEHFAGDLRQALLDAAVATLDEVGADKLSLREVARRAGVSHAAPAHHFTDKAGLLTAIASEGFGILVTYLASAQPGGTEQPVDQLAALGRAYAQFAEENPGRFDVMFRPGLLRADDPAFQRAGDAAFQALRQHIAACQNRGWREHEPTEALAAAAWALAHGIAVLRMQGSLARHYRDRSLSGVGQLVTAMTATAQR